MKARTLLSWMLVLGAVLAAGGLGMSSGQGAEMGGPSSAAYQDFEPAYDAYINSSFPNTGWPNDVHLHVGTTSWPYRYRSLLKFDLDLPAGVVIQSATLYLYQYDSTGAAMVSVVMRRIIEPWTESVTWNSRPATSEPSATTGLGESEIWRSWNATELVRGWYNGTYSNYGMMLLSSDEEGVEGWRSFYSSEAGSLNPYLHVVYEYPTSTPTFTSTQTRTPTRTPKATLTPTATRRPTSTPTRTPTAGHYYTSTPTRTPTRTPTASATPTATYTRRPTNTPGPSPTRRPETVRRIWLPFMVLEWAR